jgi:hypothetical protein
MKSTTALLIALALATTTHAEVKVVPGDISDKRTTGKFFAGLDVEFKVSGPELVDCKGMRLILKEAKDDTGKAIPEQKNGFRDGAFEPLQKAFGGFDDGKKNEFQAKLELENPARSAKSFSIDATLDLLVPGKDPAAVVTVDVVKDAGKQLAAPVLQAGGVAITFKAANGSEMAYTIADPKKKVAVVEFCSADGKPLETGSTVSSGFNGKKDVTVTLRDKPPAGTVAKIYVLTEKSVVSVPLKLTGVALP